MKLSSKTLQIFGATIIALIALAATVTAAPTKTTAIPSFHATDTYNSTTEQPPSHMIETLHFNLFSAEDHFALRSNHFSMPQPTLYAIATLTGYGPTIRRARIRRKGNLHG